MHLRLSGAYDQAIVAGLMGVEILARRAQLIESAFDLATNRDASKRVDEPPDSP